MLRRRSLLAAGTALLLAASGCSSSDDHPGESLPETLTDAGAETSPNGDASHEPDASTDASDAADASDAPSESADEPDADADQDAADEPFDDADAGSDAPIDDAADEDALEPVDGSACNAIVEQHAIEGATHVPECSPVTYGTNPPSSGNHYPVWAAFRTYSSPLPRGYYVHDLEHGAIVVTYNCPGGCASEVAQAQAMIDALPADPLCPEGGALQRRVILTPDPLLDVRWGASAWGWTLRASCFEPQVFTQFATDHYAQGPENFCIDGYDFTAADGGLTIQPGCGSDDGGLDGGTATDASME